MAFNLIADDEHERLQSIWASWEDSGEIILENGHNMWKKAVSRGYGRVDLTLNMKEGPTVRKSFYAHVLSYSLKDRSFNWDNKRKNRLDVSHLCGEKRCVRQDHLVLETRIVNNARKNCHKRRHCFGHGPSNPKCIF